MTASANGLAQRTVAVVLAGGKGTRLGALTRDICKPALPFGAAYRCIDFSLSNCVNSGIRRIGVATQHKPVQLLRHLDDVWNDGAAEPERTVAAWRSEERAPRLGYRGTADAVFRNLDAIERADGELVLVLAGDHVYKMDYRPMLGFHRERRADVTVACIHVDAEDANQFGIVSAAEDGRIAGFVEKPQTRAELPAGERVLASMGVYVFDPDFLAGALRRDAFDARSRHDFGRDILPAAIARARVFAFDFGRNGEQDYWRDVGTPRAFWAAHLDLLGAVPRLCLDDPVWPLKARRAARLTAAHASVDTAALRSLVAEDCVVEGIVDRSVLSAGTVVAGGARVEDTVLLPDVHVGHACRLRGVIVDAGCRVPDGMIVDGTWRNAGRDRAEPVVISAADFAHEPCRSARPRRQPAIS